MEVFAKKLMEIKNKTLEKMKENKPIIMTAENWRDFKTATHCFICGDKFVEGVKKVRANLHFPTVVGKFGTTFILQVNIVDAFTMILIYNFQWHIIKYPSSSITLRITMLT